MSAVYVGPMWVLYHLKEYRGEVKGQGEMSFMALMILSKLYLISRFSENSERNYIQINVTNKNIDTLLISYSRDVDTTDQEASSWIMSNTFWT